MSVELFAPRNRNASQSASMAGNVVGWAGQLLGDAASQLCQPLARINQSIATVVANDLGQLTGDQLVSLRDAMAACEQMDVIVVGLRRLNRRQEHSNVRRCWFELPLLKTEAERLIGSQLPHRRDAIRWHGFDAGRRLYGDASIVGRLLVGLISSAMRHAGSPLVGGKAILVRAKSLSDRQLLRLSVSVEDGCFFGGTGGAQTANIVNEKEDWVELAIWRSLAAALFTHPEIVMRPNGGWEIILDLPIDSPTSVANQWAKWRTAQHASSRSSTVSHCVTMHTFASDSHCETDRPGDNVNRMLRGLMSANVGPGPMHPSQSAIFTVVAGAAVAPDAIEAFNRKLESDLGMYDLVYRISSRRWLIVWDVDAAQARTRIETLASKNLDSTSPIRLQWSAIGVLPIRDGQTARILSDRIARELLSDTETGNLAVDQTADAIDFRPSTVPSDRLMAEMRHLAARVRTQNEHLIGQARQLRPAMRENR
ncbi:MAG TPA: hypothetical protein DDZ51_20835 [Planctomycetaceae bacterium]|nr:hypothetical protein [Planctomycetaceae bacterium]